MDNHPIPQDVTGFQFRLIGNMTVKQFAYVAVGAVSAVLIYYIPLKGIFFLIFKIVTIPLAIGGGALLAFVPIAGRPIDVMVGHFFKALFAPTQFIYKKSGGHLLLSTIHIDQKAVNQAKAQAAGTAVAKQTQEQKDAERRKQLAAYLSSLQGNQGSDRQEADRLSSLFGPTPSNPVAASAATPVASTPAPTAMQPVAPAPQVLPPVPQEPEANSQQLVTPPSVAQQPLAVIQPAQEAAQEMPQVTPVAIDPSIQLQQDSEKLAQEETLITQVNAELTQAKAAEQTSTPDAVQVAHGKVLELEQKLQEIQLAKQQLEQEIQSLKVTPNVTTPIQTVPVQPAPIAPLPPMAQPVVTQPAPAPQTIAPSQEPAAPSQDTNQAAAQKAGFPSLPEDPNILLGVVRDSSGNVLPNILLEVKDAGDNPVRAFKTNQLGQFISATPLKAGTYTISLEDAKNSYKFDNQTVVVNDQILLPLEIAAHDLREELRKSLFA